MDDIAWVWMKDILPLEKIYENDYLALLKTRHTLDDRTIHFMWNASTHPLSDSPHNTYSLPILRSVDEATLDPTQHYFLYPDKERDPYFYKNRNGIWRQEPFYEMTTLALEHHQKENKALYDALLRVLTLDEN